MNTRGCVCRGSCRFIFIAILFSVCILTVFNGCSGGTPLSSVPSSVVPPPAPPPVPPPSPAPSYTASAATLNLGSLKAGESSSIVITITPANGYAGTVTLSCSIITNVSATPTCSLTPNPVTVTAGAAATSTLTLSTSADTPGGSYAISIAADDQKDLPASNGPQSLTLTTLAVIQHVVVIFQENRTPDNLFQDPILISRGADIATGGLNSHGETIPLTPVDLGTAGPSPGNFSPGHTHADFIAMYDSGKMDGADRIECGPAANCPANPQFTYVTAADVQPYFALAEQYTFGDRMFQTNQGPSFPAHQFILSGTSAPDASSGAFVSENPLQDPAGCTAGATNKVMLLNPNGTWAYQYPCFEHPTLTDLLSNAGVTWRYYTLNAGSIWTAPNAIDHMCQSQTISGVLTCTGPDWINNVVIPSTRVLQDVANGELAEVTWIIPDGAYSDHGIANDGSGPSWVASIVNAIGNSPYWANTAIIITWDDWGGWYDHVAPKVINDGVSWGSGYVYGFRVPLIVVSPYAKAQYISHASHDFGSVLKFIETTFNLPSLNYADAPADDLSDCFVMTQSPLSFHAIAAPLGPERFLQDKRPPSDPDDD